MHALLCVVPAQSHRQSRFSIPIQPVVAIFLPRTHAHLVVDHRYGVMSGGAETLIVLNRTPRLFLPTRLRKGGGQDEIENGRPILIHAVDLDDLVVIARQIVAVAEKIETHVVGRVGF